MTKASNGGPPKKNDPVFSVVAEDWVKTIPSPGNYQAAVTSASIYRKSNVIYLHLEYGISFDGQQFTLSELHMLDADRQNPEYSRSAQGKGRVKSLLEVNGRPLRFDSIDAVPKALIGCRATIEVGHKIIDGLPAPMVRGIVGPANPEMEKP